MPIFEFQDAIELLYWSIRNTKTTTMIIAIAAHCNAWNKAVDNTYAAVSESLSSFNAVNISMSAVEQSLRTR